jgi:glycosyltransferase involved in cell wall biosynthesis
MLFLPTTGENFGHAIFEALSCAVPVLISDTTPWRGLAAIRAGWDLPLQDPTAFAAVIDAYLAMSEAERWQLQRGARAAAEAWVRETGSVATTRAMLWRALDTHAQTAQATA